ncbi:MAG: hypothetical protein H7844_02840 [Nitrospirae bacterium YQR-1]
MRKFFVSILLLFATVVPATAGQFEKDGYIIDPTVTSECQGEKCDVTVAGTVSGKATCSILKVDVRAVDNKGKEVVIKSGTSRSEGPTPLHGKLSVPGAGNIWTVRSVETECGCE